MQTGKAAFGGNGLYEKLIKKDRVLVIGGALGILVVVILLTWLLPSFEEVKLYEGKIGLVVNGNIINTVNSPMITGASVFVSLNDIKDYIDKNIFFDSANQKVIITTETKVIRLKADKNTGVSNNKVLALNAGVKIVNGTVYVPINEIKDVYNIDVKYIKGNNVVVVDDLNINMKVGTVKKEGRAIRKLPSIKEPIVEKTKKAEEVRILGEIAIDWYKVRMPNGTVGFIQKKHLNSTIQTISPQVKSGYFAWKPTEGKINLVWEQIEKVTPVMDNVDKSEGLDVVVPTWFEITDGNGTIKNKADSTYVRWAKANGYKVWGLASNGFKNDITKQFLANSNTRETIINKLLELSSLYELDGININFELDGTRVSEKTVDKEYKDNLTQFMRELTPLFREKGLTVSIAVTVKVAASANSTFFDRKALGQAVDYITLMSYDEFWSTSPVAGPVAEYGWVDKNIQAILREVPKEKLIMGIPFYSRQWKETNGKLVSNALSMVNVQNVIRQNGANIKWDEKSGQNYTEFIKNGSKIKIWVEDTKSLDMKSSLALKYDLAGVAAWRRGYESASIWGVLKRNLKDYKSFDEWQINFK